MSLFGPQKVIFLTRSSIIIQDRHSTEQLTYPKELFSFLELTDYSAFTKFIETNLNKFGSKSKYLVVLGNCFIYEKNDTETNSNAQTIFLNNLPISPSDTALLTIVSKKLLVAGYVRHTIILENTLKVHGHKLTHIIPYSLISTGNIVSDPKLYQQVLKKSHLFNAYNLHKHLPRPTQSIAKKSSQELSLSLSPNKAQLLRYLLLSSTLFVLMSLLFTLLYNQQKQQREPRKDPVITLSPSPTPEPTPTPNPTPPQIAKDTLEVVIANGTGTPGQAKKVSDLLESADFANIKTENSSATNRGNTKVSFNASITESQKTALLEILKSLLPGIEEATPSDSQNSDIYILTGN